MNRTPTPPTNHPEVLDTVGSNEGRYDLISVRGEVEKSRDLVAGFN